MLQRLGRWLRTAGYDTAIISDSRNDYEILKQARKENRCLLTCDHDLAEFRDADKHVILLESNSLESLAEQVSKKCNVNWLYKPFSRCIACNTLLEKADERQQKEIPPDISVSSNDVYYCPECNQVYWDGGHVERMRKQLDKWSSEFSI